MTNRLSDPVLEFAKKEGFRALDQVTRNNLSKSVKPPLTPAKKRSSLARPVRIHDSQPQHKRLIAPSFAFQEKQEHQPVSDCAYDEEDHGEEESWPIRLRLEQMLELTLPQTKRKKKKSQMMLMKQQQRSRHVCKDTERLLKVLSINNVDQDNRYNVTRCSVM